MTDQPKKFYVYILASDRNGALYIGVMSDLAGRVWQHKTKAIPSFTSKYGVDRLVQFEVHESAEAAIGREKALKKWKWGMEVGTDREGQPGVGRPL